MMHIWMLKLAGPYIGKEFEKGDNWKASHAQSNRNELLVPDLELLMTSWNKTCTTQVKDYKKFQRLSSLRMCPILLWPIGVETSQTILKTRSS